jgi:hypothetical protein
LTISDLRFTIGRWYNLIGTFNQKSAKAASPTGAIRSFFRKNHTLGKTHKAFQNKLRSFMCFPRGIGNASSNFIFELWLPIT